MTHRTSLWQTDGWNEGDFCWYGKHFDQFCETQRQLGVCWKSGDKNQKPLWEGWWTRSVPFYLFYLCQNRPSILKYAKGKTAWWKHVFSSLLTCQHAINDESTNAFEGWPEMVEVGGCFPRTLTEGWLTAQCEGIFFSNGLWRFTCEMTPS